MYIIFARTTIPLTPGQLVVAIVRDNQMPTLIQLLPIDTPFRSFIITYYVYVLGILISFIILFQGFGFVDITYPAYLSMIIDHHSSGIPADKGYLLEGLLGDLIGIFYLLLGFSPPTAMIMWWSTGIILLSLVVMMSVKYRVIDLVDLILLVAFSRLVDTLALWTPKFDPYLVAALILSANKNKPAAITGVGIAAFLHPSIAIVSTVGVVILRAAFEKIWFVEAVIIVLLMAAIDLYLFHHFLPSLYNRAEYVNREVYTLIMTSVRWGPVAFMGSIIVPFLMMSYFKTLPKSPCAYCSGLLILWIILVVTLSCVLSFDHTRVSCLLTVAPTIVFLRSTQWRDEQQKHEFIVVFAVFFLARIVIPHVQGLGLNLGAWGSVFRVFHVWPDVWRGV
jgi:hypothetical protein